MRLDRPRLQSPLCHFPEVTESTNNLSMASYLTSLNLSFRIYTGIHASVGTKNSLPREGAHQKAAPTWKALQVAVYFLFYKSVLKTWLVYFKAIKLKQCHTCIPREHNTESRNRPKYKEIKYKIKMAFYIREEKLDHSIIDVTEAAHHLGKKTESDPHALL